MKGKLIKTGRGWEVEYNDKVGVISNNKKAFVQEVTKALLLHPYSTGFLEFTNRLNVGHEVLFEIIIVNEPESILPDSELVKRSYAKLISIEHK